MRFVEATQYSLKLKLYTNPKKTQGSLSVLHIVADCFGFGASKSEFNQIFVNSIFVYALRCTVYITPISYIFPSRCVGLITSLSTSLPHRLHPHIHALGSIYQLQHLSYISYQGIEFINTPSSDFDSGMSELLKSLRSVRFYRKDLDTHAMLDILDLNVFTSAKVSCCFKGPDGETAEGFFLVS